MIRDDQEMQQSTLWNSKPNKSAKANLSNIITMIVMGQTSSGKSSFIKMIRGDLQLNTKPTGSIEYSYIKAITGRKRSLQCYQIAGIKLQKLIPSIIKQAQPNICFTICIDLSRPQRIIPSLQNTLQEIRNKCNQYLNYKQNQTAHNSNQNQSLRLAQFQKCQDYNLINPMPFHTVIIGCKYDLIEKNDSESQKCISKALRYVAHINGCSLSYTSTHNPQHGAQLRKLIQEYLGALNTPTKFNDSTLIHQKHHSKLISIIQGTDSLSDMNLPTSQTTQVLQILANELKPLGKHKKQPTEHNPQFHRIKLDTVIESKNQQINQIVQHLHK